MQETRSVRATLVQSVEELLRYAEQWTAVTNDHPMHSLVWLINWWKIYRAPTDELFCILIDDRRGRLVGVAPFYRRRSFGQRMLRSLGDGPVQTEQLGVFAIAGWQQRAVQGVHDFLIDQRKEWDGIGLQNIETNSTGHALAGRMQESGFVVQTSAATSTWRCHVAASWQEFVHTLPKSQRKRCRKRAAGEIGQDASFRVQEVHQPGDFEYAFRILQQLHASSVREQNENLFSAEAFPRFHATVGRQFLRSKRLRLVWLEHHGKPVAAACQFLNRTSVHAYFSAIAPQAASLAPGHLLTLDMFRFAIEQGLSTVYLPRGATSYQPLWGARELPCVDVRIWPLKFTTRMQRVVAGVGDATLNWWQKAPLSEVSTQQ